MWDPESQDHTIWTYLGEVLLVTLQLRRGVLNGHQQHLHGWETGKWCVAMRHLQDGDAKGPDVSQLIVPAGALQPFGCHAKLTTPSWDEMMMLAWCWLVAG